MLMFLNSKIQKDDYKVICSSGILKRMLYNKEEDFEFEVVDYELNEDKVSYLSILERGTKEAISLRED